MATGLTSPRFHEEDAAREHIEASRWPNGPVCPSCESANVKRMGGRTQAGMFLCNGCRDKFTCRSANGCWRSILCRHRTAWFLCHRIREAMRDDSHKEDGGLGGANKVVEIDESYVGGKPKTGPLASLPQESRSDPRGPRWPRRVVPCRQCDRSDLAPIDRDHR